MSETILISLAAILVLGLATQWVAWRLKLPAILLLLVVGIGAGAGTSFLVEIGWMKSRFLDPDQLFGPLLLPLVSLSVAIILFEGGLTLSVRELGGNRRVVWRLVSLGAVVTWMIAAFAGHWLLDLSWPMATLLGANLVVTGPTVIGPLLRQVKPTGASGAVLRWEGIVIDPIGALLALMVYEVIIGRLTTWDGIAGGVAMTLLAGASVGLAAAGILYLMLRYDWAPEYLDAPLSLMLVIAAFASSNLIVSESGLAAVTVMGIALANQRSVSVRHILEFKESLTLLLLSSLFITLGARLDLKDLRALDWHVGAFVLTLVLIARPLSVALCTLGSRLSKAERLFVSGLAPRGIVAAAVASVFALRLEQHQFPGAERLVPLTFAVIIGTVTIYGLGAAWWARRLGLSRTGALGLLIVGANSAARAIAQAIQKEGYEVLLVDTNPGNIRAARLAGLPVMQGSAVTEAVLERLQLSSIGRMLAMTPNDHINSLAATHFARIFGARNIFQIVTRRFGSPRDSIDRELRGRLLFHANLTLEDLTERIANGATIRKTKLTREFGVEKLRETHGSGATVLFAFEENRSLLIATASQPLNLRAGHTVLTLVDPAPSTSGSGARGE